MPGGLCAKIRLSFVHPAGKSLSMDQQGWFEPRNAWKTRDQGEWTVWWRCRHQTVHFPNRVLPCKVRTLLAGGCRIGRRLPVGGVGSSGGRGAGLAEVAA